MDNWEDPTPIESNPSSSEPNSLPIPVLVATSSTNSNTESEDQRFKLKYVRFCFGRLYDVEEAENFTIKVKDALIRLFEHFMNVDENVEVVHSVGTSINENVNVDLMVINDDMLDDLASQFKKHLEEEGGVQKKNEVERYLGDDFVSEAAFSTGGRILDSFRSSLSPSIVQALVCCQNWLSLASIPINIRNFMDFIENSEMIESEFGESLKISTECL
uniref:HAT C-terminal dimerisation domain-containing protein n=1 Tax=Populus trichocarpa TaxID=3694 RepID=A0A2K2C921_POPTR